MGTGFFSASFSQEDINNAKKGANRVYFQEGLYGVQVRLIKGDKSMDDDVPFVVAEFDILKRFSAEGNNPGSQANFFTYIKKKNGGLARCKEILAALYGIPFESVDDKALDLMVSSGNPCRGRVCMVKARDGKIGENKDKDFTFHDFAPWKVTDEEITQLRAAVHLPPDVGA